MRRYRRSGESFSIVLSSRRNLKIPFGLGNSSRVGIWSDRVCPIRFRLKCAFNFKRARRNFSRLQHLHNCLWHSQEKAYNVLSDCCCVSFNKQSSCFILKLVLVLVHTWVNRFGCNLSSGVVSLPPNLRKNSCVASDFVGSRQIPKPVNAVDFVYEISHALGNKLRPALSFEHFFSDKS